MENLSCLVFDSPLVPKNRRRPRTRRARSSPLQGSFSELLNCKDGSSSSITDSSDQASNEHLSVDTEEIPELPLLKCSISWNGKDKGIIVESLEVPMLEVESVGQISLLDSCGTVFPHIARENGSSSNDRVNTHSSAGPLLITCDGPLCGSGRNTNSWLAPGNVVWAKTAFHEWWPAEVMDERSLECTRNNHGGHVLVQFCGSHEHAWLEPAVDLSQFDYCYEERSKNPLQAFQDALKQALCKHVHTSSRAEPDACLSKPNISCQHNGCETRQPSSKTDNDFADEGRGRRTRKRKVHFDEMICVETPKRKVRRLRIMRYLGLVAPVGSPFSLPH